MNNMNEDAVKKKIVNFNTMVDLIDSGSGRMRLVRTDCLESVKDIDLSFLKELYNSKDKVKVIYASIYKAAVLQKRVCFLFSRNELDKLVKADSDNRYRSVNEKDYSSFIMHIMGNGILDYSFPENEYSDVASLVFFNSKIVKSFYELESPAYYFDQHEKAKEIYTKRLEKSKKKHEEKLKRQSDKDQMRKRVFEGLKD